MKLDKTHLNQFENISPPMREALTMPLVGDDGRDVGIMVYVCISRFHPASNTLRRVAVKRVCDGLVLKSDFAEEIAKAKRALKASDSYDDEHDALVALYEAITGEDAPEATGA